MERRVSFIVIGALIFLITILFIIFVLWFGRINLSDEKIREYHIYTNNDISGIAVRTPVKYKGINIGHITGISFDENDAELIKITLIIDKKIPVREDSTLVIDSQGLVGVNYLTLRQNPNGKIIDYNKARLILEKTFMEKMTTQANKITTTITEEVLSRQNVENLTKAINSLSAFVVRLDTAYESFETIVKSTANIAKNFDKKVQNGQFDIEPTLNQAQKTLQNLDAVLQKSLNMLDKFNDNPYKTLFGEH